MQNNKRLAFTLTELITACAILTGIAVFLINTKMANQTAEREAARVLEWINKLTQTANRTHQSFYFKVGSANDNIIIQWPNNKSGKFDDNNYDDKLQATSGCKYELYTISGRTSFVNFKYFDGVYSPDGSIKIIGSDDTIYYIIFSSEGRARISMTAAS